LARVEGRNPDGRPVVLFLCTHNAGRSQMVLGFFTHLAGDAAVAWSGGSEPGVAINPPAVADPDLEAVRPIRDDLERRVRRLLDQLQVTTRNGAPVCVASRHVDQFPLTDRSLHR
jgi:hypothetical protein